MKKTFFILAVFLGVSLFHTTPALAILQTDIDVKYSAWFNLFDATSGITGNTIQNSTTSNDAQGLVLSLQLNAGKNANGVSNWSNTTIAVDTINNNEKFLVKLCLDDSPTQCWLSTVPSSKDKALKPNTITMVSAQGNIVDTPETVTITAFSQTAAKGTLYQYDPTINDITPLGGLILKKGSSMTASLWYCANGSGANAVDDYNANNFHPANPTRFGSLCAGASFFQIGNTTTKITIPTTAAEIQDQAQAGQTQLTQNTTATATSSKDDNLPVCGIIFSEKGTVNGCAAQLAYGVFYVVSWIAGILGKLFDFFMGYSVSDQSYRYTFAVTGWKLVRDISNVFFIIIMVYTGFSAVFDTQKNNLKSVVPNLIINALLINFSLFATRVVIDISNITARMFYSQMIVCEKTDIDTTTGKCPAAKAKRGAGGYWPLSEKIVSSFNPQLMFKANILQPQNISTAASDTTDFNSQNTGTVNSQISPRDYANYFLVVCLIATIIMAGIGTMFFKVAFLFLGRVIGLYICMIFAPFAFLSRQMPMLGNVDTLRWTDWKKELTNYALLAPIFTFFLYIIYTFLSSNFVSEIGFVDTSGDFFGTVLSIVIPMLIIYFMIMAAQKAATKYAGSIGNTIQKYGEVATGLVAGAAIGVASGGLAYAGSRVGSRVAAGISDTRLGRWSAANADKNAFARFTTNSLGKAQTGSWDVRKATVGGVAVGGLLKNNPVFNRLGITKNVNQYAGIGEKFFEGGFKGQQERRQGQIKKNIENRINYGHLSDDQAKKVWEKHTAKNIKNKGDDGWKKNIDEDIPEMAGFKKQLADGEKKEAELKKEITDLDARIKGSKDEAEVTSLSEMKNARQADLATAQAKTSGARTEMSALRKNALGAIDSIKDKKEKEAAINGSKAFQKTIADEKKRLDEYGEVKNAKDLTNFMRREYVEDMRNKSLWMKDGKKREGVPLLGNIYGAQVLSGGISAVASVLMAERLQFEQDALDSATSAYIKDFKKTQSKDSKIGQINKKLKEYDETVENALVSRGASKDSVKDMSDEAKQSAFKAHVDDAQADYEVKNAKFEKAKKDFNSPNSTATEEEFRAVAKERKAAEDEMNKVKNVWTNKEKAQDDLQKEADKAKAASDKK